MIDSQTENLLSLTDAARLLPARRGGKRPHVSCMYRWTTAGCRGVVLESISIGGTRCTSREALSRFFAALSGHPTAPSVGRSVAQRLRDLAAAERELRAAGI